MRKLLYFALALGLFACSNSADENKQKEQTGNATEIEQKVEEILSGLSLKEKIGQMTQLNIDVISVGEIYNLKEPHELDSAKLRKALVEYGVGSILNVGGHAYSLEHWREITSTIQRIATKETESKIPVIYGIDAIHGANYLLNGTLFPQPLAQAATFNPAMVEKAAAATAYETRACGIPWNFSPVLDVARQPLWSRVFETYGEDVYLCTQMGVATVKGYEGDNPGDPFHVASCMKHFLGYSIPFTGKDRTPSYIPERQLREYFLPTFKAAVHQGSLSIMINSGELNGIPVHADKEILTDLLRTELGFDGVAVTDWEDIMKLEHPHRVAKDLKEAVKIAVNAGIDMSMVPNDYRFCDLLYELVEEGDVPMSRIDESVRRVLTMKFRLNLFDEPFTPANTEYPKVASGEFLQLSHDIAAESITLLKNDGILPLKSGQRVSVTGPMASSLTNVNGSWSRTWQGRDTKWNDNTKLTLFEAIQTHDSTAKIVEYDLQTRGNIVIACMGELPSTEKPGDIHSLDLEQQQIDHIRALHNRGNDIILVLVQNRPRIVREIEPFCKAIVMAYQPSENGTKAVADVLFGSINPSGKLPITYPRHTNSLLLYDHKYTEKLNTDFSETAFNPQWEFGHGLSYSNFEYENLEVQVGEDQLNITVDVNNTSDIDGKETVLVFVSDMVASITPSVKRLRAFDKKAITAGSSETYNFAIHKSDLAFINKENQWEFEPGEFVVQVGNLRDTVDFK